MAHLPEKQWKKLLKLKPSIVTDGVLIENGSVLLVKRSNAPFRGKWAFPGGFVNNKERVARACERELFEESGLKAKTTRLVGIYDNPRRDPRGHLVSIVFMLEKKSGSLRTSEETSDARFFPLNNLPALTSDHKKIIKDAIRLQSDVVYTVE